MIHKCCVTLKKERSKMKLISRFLGLFNRERSGGEADKNDQSLRSGAYMAYDRPLSGAMAVSTVYRCVALLSGSVASLPLQYLCKRGGRFVEDTENSLHYLLTVQPNPSTSAYDFWERVVQDVLQVGNAYIYPDYDCASMSYSRLVLCARGSVRHDTLLDTYSVNDPIGGVYGTFDSDEIIHIKGMPGRNACSGISVMSYARMATSIASAGDRETNDRFIKGGNMRAFVTDDKGTNPFNAYAPDQVKKVASNLSERVDSGERFVSVPTGVTVEPFTLSSSDMQFLESRKFTVREICRFFGVHPSFVFDDTSNNYKSAEMSNVAFLSNTLNPLLLKIENELHRKLVPEQLCCKRRLHFDRRGLFASDLDSKLRYYQNLLSTGIHTVNELRKLENMAPVNDGDRVLVSANLRLLSEIVASSMATESKTKPINPDDNE